ncbi:FAD-binding oxidoreductase [Gammaproteobacteria bacterium]|nr:FAD-binding oxidoreductase [Gammaproteobacteria bacterium]
MNNKIMTLSEEIKYRLREIVGENGSICEPNRMEPYLNEERGLAKGKADIVLRPDNVQDVSSIVKVCAEKRIPIVPVGGCTGLVGGTLANGGVILATDRLKRIIEVDPINNTITAESGCVLAGLQAAAAAKECLLPLSLGAEGSCQIGGNLSTNAGGVSVLRYGNTRDLVLGLEVVLPNGEIWNDLNALRKDNTGYDLKQLFIGAEGTLGIITKAVLKLFPAPKMSTTVLVALPKIEAILVFFKQIREVCGDQLTAFELISRIGIELGSKHVDGVIDPFEAPHPWYALIELTSTRENDNIRANIEEILANALEANIIVNAVFAESDAQRKKLWKIREELPAAQSREGASIKHDVSVPVSDTVNFIIEASERLLKVLPSIRPCPFGHIGDGNIHYNLTQPIGMAKEDFMARSTEINRIVHDLVTEMRGSISAEHGIGSFKREELEHYASPSKMLLIRTIKHAIDPQNIMNPGKII